MDDAFEANEPAALPLNGPHSARFGGMPSQSAFEPLKLTLLPSGLTVELTRPEMLVGRHSGADVRLPLPDVSRRHCRFLFQDGQWWVFDLESLNGIYVNHEKVKQSRLSDRDILTIGGFSFEVEFNRSAAPKIQDATQAENSAAVIKSIAEVLPAPTELRPPQRKAS